MIATVVIPCIDSDQHLAQRAIASVESQTIPTAVIPVHDKSRRGPQWGRNQGILRAKTHFITFLDADDTLAPTFIEECVSAYEPNHYVYTDYKRGGSHKMLPPHKIVGLQYGLVTRLVRTETARSVGGFNERLRRLEDNEFWLRVRASGICGIHIRKPLVSYSIGGKRSTRHDDIEVLRQEMKDLYERFNMACCDGRKLEAMANRGEKHDGDVLALANWGGNRTFKGKTTGRNYPRTGNGKPVWVSPEDLRVMPELVPAPTIKTSDEQPIDESPVVEPVESLPDEKARLIALAEEQGVEIDRRWGVDRLREAVGHG